MGLIIFLILAYIVFVVLDLKHARYMKNRYALILAILSVAWWAYLVIGQLHSQPLICTPEDAFCNEGNTVKGKIVWGTMLALMSLFYVWLTYIIVAFTINKRKNNIKSKPKL